jgi:aminoglycoside/choline kinase family phosphotransferase
VEYQVEKLKRLFQEWSGEPADQVIALPVSGSERRYFRLSCRNISAIGAWNPIKEENIAFLYFSRHFLANGLHVPAIYGEDLENNVYLLQDLGYTSLFSLLEERGADTVVSKGIINLYKESLRELIRFQVVAGRSLDYSYCYPLPSFDISSMKWDLTYFKYYFLKLHVPFHEARLEDDFDTLVNYLAEAGSEYFMYRDFQSRNIYIKDERPYFIDYQGGRKGPLQYDLASLLFQVRADLPNDLREYLLDYYISELSSFIDTNPLTFKRHYYGFVLIRLLQVLGAYGFRGIIEKKPHFLASIPFALKNLAWWLNNVDLPVDIPELSSSLNSLAKLEKYRSAGMPSNGKLTLFIRSFSYIQGIPQGKGGHGGGFVFDCRALPNPGREERYKAFNGMDKIIIDFLENMPEVIVFLNNAEKLVSQSIENYLERGFDTLEVNFGCTGGQHRSVYCAETMATRLRQKYSKINIEIVHAMLNEK